MYPQVVTDYLQKECSLGRMLGPFSEAEPLPRLHFTRFGAIPKGTNTGKFQLITDLSFPTACSVNDGITPDLCTLAYTTVDVVASQAAVLGVGAQLAKTDIEAAYRLIPVHPQDRILSHGFRADLAWWEEFIAQWNGISVSRRGKRYYVFS